MGGIGGARYLVIPDLQIPFHHTYALKFAKAVAKEFRIPSENILCVGDELDSYYGSSYPKNPNANHTAVQEFKEAVAHLKEWYAAFPICRVAISNHGVRWAKRASEAGIPSELMRSYREILEAPKGWIWSDEWIIKAKHRFRMIHGMGYSGMNGHRTAALDAGMSTIIGHLHSHAGIAHIKTGGQRIWGFNAGALIDETQYAFSYGKDSRFKSVNGVGVILDDGLTPLFLPLERF